MQPASTYALGVEETKYWYASPARARAEPADEQPARTHPVRSWTKTRAVGTFPRGKSALTLAALGLCSDRGG
jgi:hypothetical protein